MDLLTRIVEEAHRVPEEHTWKRQLITDLKAAIPIRVQNVADYLYLESGREKFDFHTDCPNVAPPWSVFFMSYKIHGQIRTRDGWQATGETPHEIGFLFTGKREESTGEWLLNTLVFEGNFGCGFRWHIDKEGHFISPANKPAAIPFEASPLFRWPEFKICDGSWRSPGSPLSAFAVPFLAISFCHCKNVEISRQRIAPKVKAKREREHGWSPDAWHTLQIEPMRKQLAAAGAHEPGGLKRALHIMRGHFKDYREGRGLFGKQHGIWWWDFRLADSSHKHRYESTLKETKHD